MGLADNWLQHAPSTCNRHKSLLESDLLTAQRLDALPSSAVPSRWSRGHHSDAGRLGSVARHRPGRLGPTVSNGSSGWMSPVRATVQSETAYRDAVAAASARAGMGSARGVKCFRMLQFAPCICNCQEGDDGNGFNRHYRLFVH